MRTVKVALSCFGFVAGVVLISLLVKPLLVFIPADWGLAGGSFVSLRELLAFLIGLFATGTAAFLIERRVTEHRHTSS